MLCSLFQRSAEPSRSQSSRTSDSMFLSPFLLFLLFLFSYSSSFPLSSPCLSLRHSSTSELAVERLQQLQT